MGCKTTKKVVVKAKELSDVDVSFISLVKNAANRSPFKILKHDKTEGDVNIDLAKLFSIRKVETKPAVVLAGVIVKSNVLESAMEQLKGMGAVVFSKTEVDGIHTLNLLETMPEELSIVKMDDGTAVMVTGISKMFENWPASSDFAENIKKSGFFPALHVASDVLISTIYNAMETIEKGESPTTKISEVMTQFSEYVTMLVDAVPVTAFKFEKLKKAETVVVPVEVPKVETVEKAETPVTPVATPAELLNFDDFASKLIAQVGTMVTEQVTAAVNGVADINKQEAAELKTLVTGLVDRITKTEDSLRGIVSVSTQPDTVVKKQEGTKKVSLFQDVLKFDGLES